MKNVISGDIKAPPKDVLEGKTIRVLDLEQAEQLYQKGKKLMYQYKFVDALDCFNKAEKLYPFSPEIHLDKAITLYELNELSDALSACESCLILNPNLVKTAILVRQLKGDIFFAQGKLEEALNFFNQALDIHPSNHHHFSYHHHSAVQKARILANLGREKEALDACDLGIKFDPLQQNIVNQLRSQILSQNISS